MGLVTHCGFWGGWVRGQGEVVRREGLGLSHESCQQELSDRGIHAAGGRVDGWGLMGSGSRGYVSRVMDRGKHLLGVGLLHYRPVL